MNASSRRSVKTADLVIVLPHGSSPHIIVGFIRNAYPVEAKEDLGPLWHIYNEETGIAQMHEKWLRCIAVL